MFFKPIKLADNTSPNCFHLLIMHSNTLQHSRMQNTPLEEEESQTFWLMVEVGLEQFLPERLLLTGV